MHPPGCCRPGAPARVPKRDRMNRPFDPAFALAMIPSLLPYFAVTIGVTAASALAGSCIGLGVARARLSRTKAVRAIAAGYTAVLRSTPSIVLLFLVFYGFPAAVHALTGINIHFWHRAVFVIITFTLLFSATMSEVFRSAWLSVDRGQFEAAVSAGLSPAQAQLRIVLPQAAVSAIPNFGNALISLMKEGALAYMVGLIDAMGQGFLVVSRNYGARSLETFLALAVLYWALTAILERVFLLVERRLSRGLRGVSQ